MGTEKLVASQRVLTTSAGDALGCSYRWPGGQYCAIHTDRGIVGCGIYDCATAGRFGMAVAIARGTPEHPLCEPEDLLGARIVEISDPARHFGVAVGMTGAEALEKMLQAN